MIRLVRCLIICFPLVAFAQQARIEGQLTGENRPVSLTRIVLQSQNLQTITDKEGKFVFDNIKPGKISLYCYPIGFSADSMELTLAAGAVQTVQWVVYPQALDLNDVVVTGTRTVRRKLDSPIAVNILDAKTFQRTQSVCLSDGLAFQPGLRMETDCQTCNYSQLRMNGLGGSYSQILINGRPLFSSLMGLYGLEQIPSNAISRVEVVRGSGSVLYGSNAIAGTINVITKLPERDGLSVQVSDGWIATQAHDLNIQANCVAVNDSATAGLTIFTGIRKRSVFDANDDGYSEMPSLNGYSVGLNAFLKTSKQTILEAGFWQINEERRGGNAFDRRPDQADQSEYRLQNSSIAQLSFTWNARNNKTSVQAFSGGQLTQRTHYTGIDQADGWGKTHNTTMQSGVQLTRRFQW